MADVTLSFYRVQTEHFEDEAGRKTFHRERAKLLHGLADAMGLDIKDWGLTDAEYPREHVEIVMALAPIIIPAVASVINTWLKQRKLSDVKIKQPNGTEISLGKVSLRDFQALLNEATATPPSGGP